MYVVSEESQGEKSDDEVKNKTKPYLRMLYLIQLCPFTWNVFFTSSLTALRYLHNTV